MKFKIRAVWTSIERTILKYSTLFVGVAFLIVYLKGSATETTQTFILFLTLLALTFYVRDTNRLANSTAIQARSTAIQFKVIWIAEIFKSLSTRIDNCISDIDSRDFGPYIENIIDHQKEINSSLGVLLNIWPTVKENEKRDIIRMHEEFNELLTPIPPSNTEENRMKIKKSLFNIKENLQMKIGNMTDL